jgi:hypothetical protein
MASVSPKYGVTQSPISPASSAINEQLFWSDSFKRNRRRVLRSGLMQLRHRFAESAWNGRNRREYRASRD